MCELEFRRGWVVYTEEDASMGIEEGTLGKLQGSSKVGGGRGDKES